MFQILLMAPPQGGGADWTTFVFLIGIFVIMYFFMIRPQAKKQKDQKNFIEQIQKGQKIVTVSGVHGKISKVNEDGTLDVEIANNVHITIERSGISLEMSKARNAEKK